MTRFVLATANVHKAEELRAVLGELDVELLARPLEVPEVDETDDTLEGNAALKARALVLATGRAAIADDTGLFVDALEGRPGVRCARFAGENATDEQNVRKLLDELAGVPEAERRATFRTVMYVAYPDGESLSSEGVLQGHIAVNPRGTMGFGYDPVFVPEGLAGRTLAELSPDEKNAVSHRARALRALAAMLAEGPN